MKKVDEESMARNMAKLALPINILFADYTNHFSTFYLDTLLFITKIYATNSTPKNYILTALTLSIVLELEDNHSR